MKFHIVRLGLVAVGAIVLNGSALAQNVPEQFVVSGKAAEQIQDFTTINLATAERLADACEEAAAKRGVGISIMVVDHGGNQVYMDRMDGQGYLNITSAESKARTALMIRSPTKVLLNNSIKEPEREHRYIQLGEFPNAGGLPIVVSHQLIGAVGVGGSGLRPPVWGDEICAHEALLQVFGPSVPPLVEDLPPPQNPNAVRAPVQHFATATSPKSVLPAEWVVNGKNAAKIFTGTEISLATAKKIARVCRDWAASKGGSMSLYILDNAGEFVHMERMDGQVFDDIRTALQNAQTALKTRQPTRSQGSINLFNLYSDAGGIPIVVDGQMIGAIGVGGGAGSGGNENCAIEGLKATFGDRVTLPSIRPPSGSR